jgi:cytochrome c peroxidase
MKFHSILSAIAITFLLISCNNNDANQYKPINDYANVKATFGSNIDLENLENYANQTIPSYITKDNSNGNTITDKEATLGRILFYDKNLSANNTISCASCHLQAFAFGDNVQASVGINGTTSRHTMRLINSRFSVESKFFWDERAASLELQVTEPIQDHIEMGFSGANGDGNFETLIAKLQKVDYYKELFTFVYGNETISEQKIQTSLAQFIRSIQSFDSKYDIGRAQANNDEQPFLNFSDEENAGKDLFLTPPQFNQNGNRIGGGIGCASCHAAPEFDIDPNSKNNGVIRTLASGNELDLLNTRSPTLRDVVKSNGELNGQMMHAGNFVLLSSVLEHYNNITINPQNNNLDPRLMPNGFGQRLNLTIRELNAITAFMKTLSGSDVYVNKKWGDPFP